MNNNKPLWKIRVGGVEATAWNNASRNPSGESVDRVTVTIDRRYRDAEGNWKTSTSLGLNDLLKAQVAIRHAIDRIVKDKSGGEAA